MITLSVFPSRSPGCEDWGTDIYDQTRKHIGRAPAAFNQGFAFIPATDTLARRGEAQFRNAAPLHHHQLRQAGMALAPRIVVSG